MKSLVIAEKPSVAADLARALGGFTKQDDFFESDTHVISSAIGHLVELCMPGDLDKKRGKWSLENLPIIPDEFALKPIEKNEARLKLLQRLIRRKDIGDLVNACDAGREGELIFRYIVQITGAKKPVRRLWLQSMTKEAIRSAVAALRTDDEMRPLADAALCRSESDWLVGINSTRAMTAFNNKRYGGFQLTPVGRVQTPTLAIIVEREERIRRHVPRPYQEIHATFQVAAGTYQARWFDPNFKKTKDKDKEKEEDDLRSDRLWDRPRAEAILAKCLHQTGEVSETIKPQLQYPGSLLDLTTLQREANRRFGYSAKTTLQIAQELYERHKALTYPRTDSRHLPEDYLPTVRNILQSFASPELDAHARKILENNWLRPDKRIFDNTKVSDHFAIIPTGEKPGNLTDSQQRIYDFVSRRFIAIFYPPAKFAVTARVTTVQGESFRTDGKVLLEPGWLAVFGKEAELPDDSPAPAKDAPPEKAAPRIAPLAPGEKNARNTALEIRDLLTRPPARFNESSLLSAMEGAGKLLEDEELKEAMKEKGLGTPATRAATIEGLIYDKYIIREQKDLIATQKGMSLIQGLRTMGAGAVCSAELTGEWEHQLKLMEQGRTSRPLFMESIRALTREVVAKVAGFDETREVSGDYARLQHATCPSCATTGHIQETYSQFRCTSLGCAWFANKSLAGRQFSPEEMETLILNGKIGPLDNFMSKMGRPFSAEVRMSDEGRPGFDFEKDKAEANAEPEGEPLHVTERGRIFLAGSQYLFRSNTGDADFRSGKTILEREIPLEQFIKLAETGRTDLLDKFISRKKRPFSAYLVLGPDTRKGAKKGALQVSFEFEEREEKPGAKKYPARTRPGSDDTATVSETPPAPKPRSAPARFRKKPDLTTAALTEAATPAPAKKPAPRKRAPKATPPPSEL